MYVTFFLLPAINIYSNLSTVSRVAPLWATEKPVGIAPTGCAHNVVLLILWGVEPFFHMAVMGTCAATCCVGACAVVANGSDALPTARCLRLMCLVRCSSELSCYKVSRDLDCLTLANTVAFLESVDMISYSYRSRRRQFGEILEILCLDLSFFLQWHQ